MGASRVIKDSYPTRADGSVSIIVRICFLKPSVLAATRSWAFLGASTGNRCYRERK